MAELEPEFEQRNVKAFGLTGDPVAHHQKWAIDIKDTQGAAPTYPFFSDTHLRFRNFSICRTVLIDCRENRPPLHNHIRQIVIDVFPSRKSNLSLSILDDRHVISTSCCERSTYCASQRSSKCNARDSRLVTDFSPLFRIRGRSKEDLSAGLDCTEELPLHCAAAALRWSSFAAVCDRYPDIDKECRS